MTNSNSKIVYTLWDSSDTGIVILSEDWNDSTNFPPLLLGPSEVAFLKIERLSPEECGLYIRYYRTEENWVFAIRSSRFLQLMGQQARVFLGGDFNGWADAIGQYEWELKPVNELAETTYELQVPIERIPLNKNSSFKFVTDQGVWLDVPDSAPNRVIQEGISNFQLKPRSTGRHIFRLYMPINYEAMGNEKIIWREANLEQVYELPRTQFLKSAKTNLELGALVHKDSTVFRLFAPRASLVKVSYGTRADCSNFITQNMSRCDTFTWEFSVDENLSGYFYNYTVEGVNLEGTTHFNCSFSVLDPYAKACIGRGGPGIIVAPERISKVATNFSPPLWHDMIILEAHLRDLTARAPIQLTPLERRGYTGLRKWLKDKACYLKELGVNVVELQPIQEFDNEKTEDYHWGYMTVNYFSPESSYALNPQKASQIEEFRGLVADFHDQDIAVIIDVVYNHVGEPNHLLHIDKYYYFHLDQANDLFNWSGCGNDLRCDTPMGLRLIIDSLTHLIQTYDVDGFRFDLAELLGVEVLQKIEVELKKVKSSIILIAEPWSFRGHVQDELKATGFASWNDGFRDRIADYVLGNADHEVIRYFISGSPNSVRFAAQSINYTESHDDYCWLDLITERPNYNGNDPTFLDRRRTHLMVSILFCSLGVPMLAQGQDFLRSKLGFSNTYQRGDINALDYNRRFFYSGTHTYFRDWIKFRLSDLGIALRYDGYVQKGYIKFFYAEESSAIVVYFNADQSLAAPQIVYAINPHLDYATIDCAPIKPVKLKQIADQERFSQKGINCALIPLDDKRINMPPLSCGLWVK